MSKLPSEDAIHAAQRAQAALEASRRWVEALRDRIAADPDRAAEIVTNADKES